MSDNEEDRKRLEKGEYALGFHPEEAQWSLYIPKEDEDGDVQIPRGGMIITAMFMRLRVDEAFADEMVDWIEKHFEDNKVDANETGDAD